MSTKQQRQLGRDLMSEDIDWAPREAGFKCETWEAFRQITKNLGNRPPEIPDDNSAGDREPRNPKIQSAPGAVALELIDNE